MSEITKVIVLLQLTGISLAVGAPNKGSRVRCAKPSPTSIGRSDVVGGPKDHRQKRISKRKTMNTPSIPALDEIESITAAAYSHVHFPLVKDISAFRVPASYHHKLLDYFRNAELDSHASQAHEEFGTMQIRLNGGGTLRLCWFWTGQGARLSFSCAGIRYRTAGPKFADDETLEFDSIIRQISEKEERKE